MATVTDPPSSKAATVTDLRTAALRRRPACPVNRAFEENLAAFTELVRRHGITPEGIRVPAQCRPELAVAATALEPPRRRNLHLIQGSSQ